MKVMLVAGARPNFMEVAPLFHALSARKESGGRSGSTCADPSSKQTQPPLPSNAIYAIVFTLSAIAIEEYL
jgi:hypothetical protein